ncbi:MAG: hypothetical protein WCB96_11025 [Candidatus Aminicenantales bacterium]
MAKDKTQTAGWALLRLILALVFILPWFFSCPPPQPSAAPAPPPPPPPEEKPLPPSEPPAKTEETVPAKEEKVEELSPEVPADYESMRSLVVSGNEPWIDLGFDVEEGKRFFFLATGFLSLQKGNPTAVCGPDGYKLRTVQQPMPGQNIGALIGKVVQLLSVETDPETKKEIRHERVEYFLVGSRAEVTSPLTGRMFLGVNELVVGDNEGAFQVTLYVLK